MPGCRRHRRPQGPLRADGLGIVYCREELVDALQTPFIRPPARDGASVASAHANSQFDYMRVAHRLEGGNPNFLGIRVLRKGAEFLHSIGLPNIEQRFRGLSTHCLRLLRQAGLKTPCACRCRSSTTKRISNGPCMLWRAERKRAARA
ncbi:MAG: aminotransferase class V-fold PLP-dependent enzyme [Casimicrobiaceae bacterium]